MNLMPFDFINRNYWKDSPFQPECSSECKMDILCQARSGRSHDKFNLCRDLVSVTEETDTDKIPEIPNEISIINEDIRNAQSLHTLNASNIWIVVCYVLALLAQPYL